MSRDHHVDSVGGRVDGQIVYRMQHVEPGSFHVQEIRLRDRLGPWTDVVVAANRGHRRDLAQPLEDCVVADVAGVNDEVASRKRIERFAAKEPVCIGYEADRAHDFAGQAPYSVITKMRNR